MPRCGALRRLGTRERPTVCAGQRWVGSVCNRRVSSSERSALKKSEIREFNFGESHTQQVSGKLNLRPWATTKKACRHGQVNKYRYSFTYMHRLWNLGLECLGSRVEGFACQSRAIRLVKKRFTSFHFALKDLLCPRALHPQVPHPRSVER